MARRTWTVREGADLGRAIAEVRHDRHLNQEEVAALVGLRRDRLAKLEAGTTTIAVDQLLRTLRRLGAEINVTFETGEDLADTERAHVKT